jgi:hypothetical protein
MGLDYISGKFLQTNLVTLFDSQINEAVANTHLDTYRECRARWSEQGIGTGVTYSIHIRWGDDDSDA